jgi:threonine dehydrogenase-like Zn-dependent dehydrogenase
VKRYLPRCFDHIRAGHIRPSDVITHRFPLEEIGEAYHMFSSKLDDIIKPLVLPPSVPSVAPRASQQIPSRQFH